MHTKPIKFTTSIDYGDYPRFAAGAERVLPSPEGHPRLHQHLQMFFRILRAARQDSVLVLRSSWAKLNVDVLAGAIIGLWPRRYRPIIVLTGCMWEPEQTIRHLAERAVVKLLDRTVCLYAVQSSEELTVFPETWHVSPTKMRLCPYFFTFSEQDMVTPPSFTGNYVFAGGNSHRAYGPLLEAARQLPDLPFILATDLLKGVDLPPNVTAAPVQHSDFVRLMREATAVVVPIRKGMRRAAGQQTYLNAMWMGKPTIISDGFAVHDHVEDRVTGLIVDGTVDGYLQALRWVFDPDNSEEVKKICKNGSFHVRTHFTFEHHAERLLEIIEEAVITADCQKK